MVTVPGTSLSLTKLIRLPIRTIYEIAAKRLRVVIWSRILNIEVTGRVYFRSRPVIRRPHGFGALKLEDRVELYEGLRFNFDARDATIEIGAETFINYNTEFWCSHRIVIGARCAISSHVIFMDHDYHSGKPPSAINVGNDVWIGVRATILRGVTIGSGAIVAAGALVIRDVPARSMVAGVPARVVKSDVSWNRSITDF